MINRFYSARFCAHAFCIGAVFVSAPAFADHMGPSGLSSGGGMNVLSPDTLDEGHASVGFRLTYARPDQRSDKELEALASEHIHAHNTDYNLNASIGAAYGVTHELTVSAELPYVHRVCGLSDASQNQNHPCDVALHRRPPGHGACGNSARTLNESTRVSFARAAGSIAGTVRSGNHRAPRAVSRGQLRATNAATRAARDR